MADTSAVYMGNLNFDTAADRVISFVQEMGVYNGVVDLKTRSDGSSMGWALVQFPSPDEAASAVTILSGAELDGRALRVNIDRGTKPGRGGGGGGGGGGGFNGGGGGGGGGFGGDAGFGAAPVTNSLYVGNLAWSVDDTALYQLFGDSGATSANIATGHDGRSRGFGIVGFTTPDEASAAIDAFNGFEHEGRPLTVRLDVPRESRPPRARGGGGGGGGFVSTGTGIFVRNLPTDMTWTTLKDVFAEFGPEFADVKVGPDGLSRGWGTVRFADAASATAAIESMNGSEIPGGWGPLEVRIDNKA
jgi:RNA recognition motif-containing protein